MRCQSTRRNASGSALRLTWIASCADPRREQVERAARGAGLVDQIETAAREKGRDLPLGGIPDHGHRHGGPAVTQAPR